MSACCDITKVLIYALCLLAQTFCEVKRSTEVNHFLICKGSQITAQKNGLWFTRYMGINFLLCIYFVLMRSR